MRRQLTGGADFSFKTLGDLERALKGTETDAMLRAIIMTELPSWRRHRNSAIHEMVKLAKGNTRTWTDRIAALETVARDGLRLLRRVDQRAKAARKLSEGCA